MLLATTLSDHALAAGQALVVVFLIATLRFAPAFWAFTRSWAAATDALE